MVFSQDSDDLQGEGKVRSIFDPCCGTGGMLTTGQEWVHDNINDKVEFRLLGQELNPQTYSICKSDMMITGENPENIRQGSSLSEDRFQGDYDTLLANFLDFLYEQDLPDMKKKEMIVIIADHLYKSAFVVDKEINAFACLVSLEKAIT